MLSKNNKDFLKELFFNFSITRESLKLKKKDAEKNDESFWGTLYNFILQYRKQEIKDDELLENWLFNIAPGCVYPEWESNKDVFKCVFCPAEYKKTCHIVRHYKEKHNDQIPKEIFGPSINYDCEICNLSYVRKDYYIKHLESELHKSKQDPDYQVKAIQRESKLKKTKRDEMLDWNSKRFKSDEYRSNTENKNFEKQKLNANDVSLFQAGLEDASSEDSNGTIITLTDNLFDSNDEENLNKNKSEKIIDVKESLKQQATELAFLKEG